MPVITINNNQFNKLPTGETVNNFLQYLTNENINTAGHVITELIINDKTIDLNNPGEILTKNVAALNSLSIQTRSSLELAFEAIQSLPVYLDAISSQILEVVQLFREGENEIANKQFAESIETIELFIQLFSGVQNSLTKNLPQNYQKSEIISECELKLLEIVKEIITIKELKDVSMLCDLLEYELVANLNEWKALVIPELMKEKEKL